jgi:deoxyribodipyrimidine photo-lyase
MVTKIVWFRNDLRLHDNETLTKAVNTCDTLIPLYIFDVRQFQFTNFGFKKTGVFRTQFLLESVTNLRNNLQAIGANLIVRVGIPENILPQLCKQYNVKTVYFSKEVTPDEIKVEDNVEKELIKINVNWNDVWTSTLLTKDDLPFCIPKMPNIFTAFKNNVEKNCTIANCIPAPTHINIPTDIDAEEIPTIERLLHTTYITVDKRAAIQFVGGETKGLQRLHTYLWERNCLPTYFETRNGLIGEDYSTKFSAWLALGCLSPRMIHQEVKKYETERIKNKSTYWLVFELLWRDFFRFQAQKNYTNLFKEAGFNDASKIKNKFDTEKLNQWIQGKTGTYFVDANMNELRLTGFMSNRGRQIVASYLVNDLKVNWLMGAEYFESQLIDYDVCSNYGNWAYIAGVGNDPRPDRYFNIEKQAATYDPNKEYRNLWLTNKEEPIL